MEYQKIVNFLDNKNDQPTKFRTKNATKIFKSSLRLNF